MTIRSDLSELDRRYRARRSSQPAHEYANPIEGYRRPSGWGPYITVAVLLILAAAVALKALA